MTDHIPAEAESMALFRVLEALKWPEGGHVLTRRQASAVQDAVEPFLRPEPSEGFATCETCGVRTHRTRSWNRAPEPSGDEREALMEAVKYAEAYMTDGGYSDLGSIVETILAAGFRRRPMPRREQIASVIDAAIYRDINPVTGKGWAASLRATDAVLALFKGAEG